MHRSRGYHLDAASRFSEGMRRLQAGEYHAAVYAFSVTITLDPDHWTAYFRRAEAYRNLGLEEQANADLEKAELLRASVRPEIPESRVFPNGAAADLSVGLGVGAFVGGIICVGAIVGAIFGGNLGEDLVFFCFYAFVICGPIVGLAGGIVGGFVGGAIGEAIQRHLFRHRVDSSNNVSAGSDSLGALGLGCSGAAFGFIGIIIVYIIIAAIFS